MPTTSTFSRLWEDAPPPAAEVTQLLFVVIGDVVSSRSFLDLTLREYCEWREAVAKAFGGHEEVAIGLTSSELTISAYGADADALWELCAPFMERPAFRGGVTVMRRYGAPGSRELITRL